jgi:hypothetical protein
VCYARSAISTTSQKNIRGTTSRIPIKSTYAPNRATVKLLAALPHTCKTTPIHKHAKPSVAIADKTRSIKDAGGRLCFLKYSNPYDILAHTLSIGSRLLLGFSSSPSRPEFFSKLAPLCSERICLMPITPVIGM